MTTESIRALLVDDEPIARKVLRDELGELTDVEVIGEAENGEQALERIRQLGPELVFLDLQMPGMDGFEVVRNLPGTTLPAIVIVTAYDQHAIQAFDVGAIDYLLKPVGQDRLARCVERVRRLRKSGLAVAESIAKLQEIAGPAPASTVRKIIAKLGKEYHLLDYREVLAFQADRELVWIVTPKQRYLATASLRLLQDKLTGLNFARVHRNTLVNLDHVAKMVPLSSHRWMLTLSNRQEFIVSKRQARIVQALLGW
jgi:two-component system LytT family response regulator